MTADPRVLTLDIAIPVYNGGTALPGAVRHLLALPPPADCDLRVIVCDDGSTDGTAARLAEIQDARLQVVSLASNHGRAGACNAAVAAGAGDYLLLLDADCRPTDSAFLDRLARHMRAGHDLVYGPIHGQAEGFWSAYLQRVERRRRADARRQRHLHAMTTGNLLLRRALFDRVGGFSAAYRHYGFEDKDLIARLLQAGVAPRFDESTQVAHAAGNTVAGYCRKMYEVARFTAPLFAADHPALYREMSFGRLDPALRPPPVGALLRWLGRHLATPAAWIADWGSVRSALPEALQLRLLQIAAAFSFLRGAAERRPD